VREVVERLGDDNDGDGDDEVEHWEELSMDGKGIEGGLDVVSLCCSFDLEREGRWKYY
jgi:hypothetical protein